MVLWLVAVCLWLYCSWCMRDFGGLVAGACVTFVVLWLVHA